MRILFLTTILPLKINSGGEIVSRLFIDNLVSLGYSVDVLGYMRNEDDESGIPSNMHLVKKIVIESKSSKLFSILNIVKSYLFKHCYSSQKYITHKYIEDVNFYLSHYNYSFIIIDHFQMGWLLKHLPDHIKIYSIAHNVESDLYEQLANTSSINMPLRYIYRREADKMQLLEEKLINRSKHIWLLTQNNKNRYIELFNIQEEKLQVVCIPPINTLDTSYSSDNKKNWDIGIIGTWTWEANNEGLKWFFEKVYPLLPNTISICIAGLGAEWLSDKYKNVSYLGFVDDADKFMAKSKVIAIPSITGDGIQIKTIQAISLGIQIVATSFALRGIDNLPTYISKVGNPVEFKDQLINLISTTQEEHIQEAKQWSKSREDQFLRSLSIQFNNYG